MSNAFFGDIRSKIVERIDEAAIGIKVAMAWFHKIRCCFNCSSTKLQGGIHVELILSDSQTNFFSDRSLPFDALERKGSKVFISTSFGGLQFMHHKFAIIDNKEVITGSYNWSNNAHTNFENILLLKDDAIAKEYSLQFDALKKREGTLPLAVFMSLNRVNTPEETIQADRSLSL